MPKVSLSIPIDFPEGNKLYRLMFEVCPPKVPIDSELISPAARIKDETIEILSPAVIIVCGKDPLHPQGEHYAALLKKHGKLHDIIKYERGYHGFGTEREDEKEEQDHLREECFEYKVNKTSSFINYQNRSKIRSSFLRARRFFPVFTVLQARLRRNFS